jgi:hypothetical protein
MPLESITAEQRLRSEYQTLLTSNSAAVIQFRSEVERSQKLIASLQEILATGMPATVKHGTIGALSPRTAVSLR